MLLLKCFSFLAFRPQFWVTQVEDISVCGVQHQSFHLNYLSCKFETCLLSIVVQISNSVTWAPLRSHFVYAFVPRVFWHTLAQRRFCKRGLCFFFGALTPISSIFYIPSNVLFTTIIVLVKVQKFVLSFGPNQMSCCSSLGFKLRLNIRKLWKDYHNHNNQWSEFG